MAVLLSVMDQNQQVALVFEFRGGLRSFLCFGKAGNRAALLDPFLCIVAFAAALLGEALYIQETVPALDVFPL